MDVSVYLLPIFIFSYNDFIVNWKIKNLSYNESMSRSIKEN